MSQNAATTEAVAAPGDKPDYQEPLPVPELPPRVLLDLVTDCNLKCPMCIVHGGTDDPRLKDFLKKSMNIENARRVLDEIASAKPLVMPGMWSEPTVNPNFKEHVR